MWNKKTKVDGKKKQATCVIILVVVIFAILWLPVHIHLPAAYFGDIPQSRFYLTISLLWNTLAYFNSCVNPIIYNYASKDFRDAFTEVMCCYAGNRCGENGDASMTRATVVNNTNGAQEMKRLVSKNTENKMDSAQV